VLGTLIKIVIGSSSRIVETKEDLHNTLHVVSPTCTYPWRRKRTRLSTVSAENFPRPKIPKESLDGVACRIKVELRNLFANMICVFLMGVNPSVAVDAKKVWATRAVKRGHTRRAVTTLWGRQRTFNPLCVEMKP
jgi:hypothetical protein